VQAQRFQSTISSYLAKEKGNWQLTDSDISQFAITDQYDSKESGVTYTYLTQQVSGIRVFNAVSTMAIRDGNVVHYANGFFPEAAKKANSTTPSISAEKAIEAAAKHLGLEMAETPQLMGREQDRFRYTYTKAGLSREDLKAELMLLPAPEELRLVWNVNIAPVGGSDWWNVRIDALTGKFIEKNNWTLYCDFGHGHQHADACEIRHPEMVLPLMALNATQLSGSYNAFILPTEAPSFGVRSLISAPHLPEYSPFGWHDTDGVDGAEYTITRGNNVYAYDDRQSIDSPGYSPDGGPGLNFDFPLDLAQEPVTNLDASLTNLFYMNNMIHDILAAHGFDEASGNFQQTNYTGNGLGNDFVVAEGQDGGGTNNANFATPSDGESGRMQMYMWIAEIVSSMEILSPASIEGSYYAVEATFGPGLEIPVQGNAVLVLDNEDLITNACDSIINGDDLAGKIAVVDRGDCSFISKANAVEALGAIAIIVVNDTPADPIAMGGAGTSNIPGVMITQADGELLKASLAAGDTVEILLALGAGAEGQDRDGSLDNGIIAHEYGHGVSNRLTGGPENSDCLFNGEQAGEGWSDWIALMLTMEEGDTGEQPRGIATYSTDDESGVGLRRYPYSTDMTINPLTYGDVATSFGPHAIGEVWCSSIWELTWKLVETEGFDPDWFHGTGGNNTAMRLVLEGMRLQGCSPGFEDARDGILKADELLYQNAHRCLIWEAFAKRGLGADADQGSSDSSSDQTEDFSVPNTCLVAVAPPKALFSVNATVNCFGRFSFTDESTDIPQYYAWDFGDGGTSTEEDPFYQYDSLGDYTVTLIVTNNVGADTFQMMVSYDNLDIPDVIGSPIVCEGGFATLVAQVPDGQVAIWSENGNEVFTGEIFETPALSATTTYSVIQSDNTPLERVGPPNNSLGGGGIHNTGFEGRLHFETFVPLKIISVLIYAQGAGDREIRLYNESDELIWVDTFLLESGDNRVMLNLEVPEPGLYSLGNPSQNLYRNNEGANYPYAVDNLLSIYRSNATSDEYSYYYYFYDWVVQEAACQSSPVDVTVEVQPGPLAGFLTDVSDLTVTFTDISSPLPTAWGWDFGDGSTFVFEQSPVHTYLQEGVYEVELTVSNGSCFSIQRQTVEVGTTSVKDQPEAVAGLKVYPNPAVDEVTIAMDELPSGKLQLNVTNATGSLVISRPLDMNTTKFAVNTSSLAAGTYQFQIVGEEGVSVRRIVIMK
jgi:PKD repeat protein